MKKIYFILIFVGIITIIINSCNKSNLTQNIYSPIYSQTSDEIDEQLTIFAKHIAKIQIIPEFRAFIERQAANLIGQEQSVLYLQTKDSIIVNNKSFKEILELISDTLGYKLSYQFFNTDLPEMLPRLTITVYCEDDEIENWEFTNPVYVLPITENMSDLDESYVYAYDKNLDSVQFSNNVEPNNPFLVIEDNCSFWMVQKSDYQILGFDQTLTGDTLFSYHNIETNSTFLGYLENSGNIPDSIDFFMRIPQGFFDAYYLISYNAIIDLANISADMGNDPDPEICNCERGQRTYRERIVKYRVDNDELKKYCKWWKHTSTIEMNNVFAEINGTSYSWIKKPIKYLKAKRKQIKNGQTYYCWFDTYFFEYCEGKHGDPYQLVFIGKNPKSGTKHEAQISTVSSVKNNNGNTLSQGATTSISYTEKDDELGGDCIYFCDWPNGYGAEYETGKFTFWVKEKEQ